MRVLEALHDAYHIVLTKDTQVKSVSKSPSLRAFFLSHWGVLPRHSRFLRVSSTTQVASGVDSSSLGHSILRRSGAVASGEAEEQSRWTFFGFTFVDSVMARFLQRWSILSPMTRESLTATSKMRPFVLHYASFYL
jgi:hypothetical protein